MLYMVILTSFKMFGGSTDLTMSSCLVNNCVPGNQVGKANGLGQTVASLSRGLGPTFAGFLWSWSTSININKSLNISNKYEIVSSYIPFGLAVITLGFGVFVVFFIPKHLQKPWQAQDETQRYMKARKFIEKMNNKNNNQIKNQVGYTDIRVHTEQSWTENESKHDL